MACRLAGANAGILLIGPLGRNVSNFYISFQKNVFEMVVRKSTAFLSRPQCVKYLPLLSRRYHVYGYSLLNISVAQFHKYTSNEEFQGPHQLKKISETVTWISNYSHGFLRDVITHPCSLAKPPLKLTQITRFMGPTWAHLGPVVPRWAPCSPHETCYLGKAWVSDCVLYSMRL